MVTSSLKEIFEMLYVVERFLQIGYGYCGFNFEQTVKEIKGYLHRKVKLNFDRCLSELIENLSMEDRI